VLIKFNRGKKKPPQSKAKGGLRVS